MNSLRYESAKKGKKQENQQRVESSPKQTKQKKTTTKLFSLRQTLCNVFRLRKFISPDRTKLVKESSQQLPKEVTYNNTVSNRALPPLPLKDANKQDVEDKVLDFATSIQKVKDVSCTVFC